MTVTRRMDRKHIVGLVVRPMHERDHMLGLVVRPMQGKGQIVECLYREVRSYAIPGGSEEIMNDLAMKQAKL